MFIVSDVKKKKSTNKTVWVYVLMPSSGLFRGQFDWVSYEWFLVNELVRDSVVWISISSGMQSLSPVTRIGLKTQKSELRHVYNRKDEAEGSRPYWSLVVCSYLCHWIWCNYSNPPTLDGSRLIVYAPLASPLQGYDHSSPQFLHFIIRPT